MKERQHWLDEQRARDVRHGQAQEPTWGIAQPCQRVERAFDLRSGGREAREQGFARIGQADPAGRALEQRQPDLEFEEAYGLADCAGRDSQLARRAAKAPVSGNAEEGRQTAWDFGAPASEVQRLFDTYVEAGGNFFDTACNYQAGAAESQLGALMGRERDRFVVATKYTMSTSPGDPNAWGNHRKNLRRSLEASLTRLKTDYVDLYQVHLWDHTVPAPEVMAALDDLVRSGKVLHLAISDAPAWVVAQANTWATAQGRSEFSAIQIEYNLLERSVEHDLVPMSRTFELPTLAWSPLGFGVLTGKCHGGAADSKRGDWLQSYLGARADRIVPEVQAIANARGVSAAQVALTWLKSRGPQVYPIIGARTVPQLEDNLRSLDLR